MNIPKQVSILRANKGELKCVANLDDWTRTRMLPLFDIGRMTDSIMERAYIRDSHTPIVTYISRTVDNISDAWRGGPVMLDGFSWPQNATAENGQHVVPLMVQLLRAKGTDVIPVVGYDRWAGSSEYQTALAALPKGRVTEFALRLDADAIEDASEPEHFLGLIEDIIDVLQLDPRKCVVLIDHGDVSTDTKSVNSLIEATETVIDLLSRYEFACCVVAGCSMPKSIDVAVGDSDSEGQIIRKEVLVWKALVAGNTAIPLVVGDYGVRGPTTTEIRSRYTNGKIRHTVANGMFVVRGHAFSLDGNFSQMYGLAHTLRTSGHYLGANFSWGDAQIAACVQGAKTGDLSHWIAVDTNHHITFVVHEVEEFQRTLVEAEESEPEDA